MRTFVSIVSAALLVAPAFAFATVARPSVTIGAVAVGHSVALPRVPGILNNTPPTGSGQNGGAASGSGGSGGAGANGGSVRTGDTVSNTNALNVLNSVLVRIGR